MVRTRPAEPHAAAARPRRRLPNLDTLEELSWEEVDERYPWEWVALVVTGVNHENTVTHGKVLSHGRREATVSRAAIDLWAVQPKTRVFIFYAGPRPKTDEEWEQRLLEAAEGPQLNAWW